MHCSVIGRVKLHGYFYTYIQAPIEAGMLISLADDFIDVFNGYFYYIEQMSLFFYASIWGVCGREGGREVLSRVKHH